MKILKVNLIAFGPFTDIPLDLRDGEQGLHIIYGLNEAGKSSALRALHYMLYGIPDRSSDDFIHPYSKMRIGGIIQHSDGTILDFIRRKGRANTLRTGDDTESLDESSLHRFLGNMDGPTFATMFGIGHDDLVRGGAEIVQGGGNLGQAIFAAGSGISDLRRVQMEILGEADALFKPAATTRPINAAIADLKKKQKEIRETQLPGQEWEVHDQALHDALNRRSETDRGLQTKERTFHWLERVRESLPLISQRKELLEELLPYANAVLLPEDFSERRTTLCTDLRIEENARDQAQKSIKDIERGLDQLEISQPLLDKEEIVETLHLELGGYQKARKDRPQLVIQRDVLWSEARDILAGLRGGLTIDEAEKLRLKRTEAAKIQDLSARYERLMTKLEAGREDIRRLSLQIDKLKRQLTQVEIPRPINGLKDAVERAVKYAAFEDHYLSGEVNIRIAQSSLETALRRQTLWSGDLEELERLSLPSIETINTFEDRFNEARQSLSQLQSEKRSLDNTILEVEGQIKELQLEHEVPTEKELQDARERRDQGWQFIRSILQGAPESHEKTEPFIQTFPPSNTLTEAYEQSVVRTDQVADRLRREADRVARKAKLLSDEETRRIQSQRLKEQIGEAETELGKIQEAWEQIWKSLGISPLTPREMRTWVQDLNGLSEQIPNLKERKAKNGILKNNIAAFQKELRGYLLSISEPPVEEGVTLSDLVTKCRRVLDRQDEIRNEREQLLRENQQKEETLTETTLKVEQIEKELSEWQKQWEEAIQPLGLEANIVPLQANAFMDDLKRLFDKLKDADNLQTRIKGIDKEADAFSNKALGLIQTVASDLKDTEIEQAVVDLNARLSRARTAKSQRESLEAQRKQKEEELRQANEKIVETRGKLDRMCEEAGCRRYEDFQESEKSSAKRRQIEFDINKVEEQLHKLSGGATIEDFIREACEVDPDEIENQMERLREEVNVSNKEKSDLDQTIGREQNELSKMTGTSRAADLAEETQRILARLESSVAHYVRLRLGSAVLSQAIELYREKHQGPILRRTNEIFATLTLNSFEGIRAEFNEQGTPVLVGVRPGGKEIVGIGGMSDGTTDQLYLALRLASIETYLQKNEPMPFIVDDILIKFDNERATATLQVLADLSKKTQVIFFTHHRHLVELAEAQIDPSVLFKHSL